MGKLTNPKNVSAIVLTVLSVIAIGLMFDLVRKRPVQKDRLDFQTSPKPLAPVTRIGDFPALESKGAARVSLQFVDDQTGWLVADAKLWRSTNGGQSWAQVYSDTKIAATISFSFIDNLRGWMTDGSEIRRTDDGGYTWRSLPSLSGRLGSKKLAFISYIQMLRDGKTGWIGCDINVPIPRSIESKVPHNSLVESGVARTAVLMGTTDGGETWKVEIEGEPGTKLARLVIPGNEVSPIIQTEKGVLRHKSHAWESFMVAKTSCKSEMISTFLSSNRFNYYVNGAHFLDEEIGWLSFGSRLSGSFLAKTGDGGRTWCDVTGPDGFGVAHGLPVVIDEFVLKDEREAWALGNEGKLRRTTNGGVTWEIVSREFEFSALFFLDSTHGWAVSKEGVYRVNL